MYSKTNALPMTTMDKAGIGVTVGILAVVLTLGIGLTHNSGVSIFEGMPVTQEKTSMTSNTRKTQHASNTKSIKCANG